jgi:hypothetical protein
MKHIDDRTVEFTEAEMTVKDRFEHYLDGGHGIPTAAKLALTRGIRQHNMMFSDEFIKHLSDNTVIRFGQGVRIRKEWKPENVAVADVAIGGVRRGRR